MKSKTIYLFIIFSLLFCACSEPQIHFVDKDSEQVSDELSSQRISCFLEDAHGYIWLGTERGLNRFNGYEYRQFLHNKADSASLCSDIVTTLFLDSQGRIWVGTMDGVCRYEGEGNFRRYDIKEDDSTVSQILETSDGTVLVNMIRRLYRYDPSSDRMEILIDDFTRANVFRNRSFLDAADRLWSVTPEKVSCYNIKTLQLIKEIPLPIDMDYSEMLPDGNIWVFGRKDKALVNTETMTVEAFPAEALGIQTSSNLVISRGMAYINTSSDIVLWDGNNLIRGGDHRFPYEISSQEMEKATVLFIDSSGNLYIAGNRGGFSIHKPKPLMYDTSDEMFTHISGFPVLSGCKDSHNRFWFVSDSDIIHVYNPEDGFTDVLSIQPFRTLSGLQIDQEIMVDGDDRVWLRVDGRLFELEYHPGSAAAPGSLSLVREHGYLGGSVMALTESPDGTIYAGVGIDNMYTLQGDRFQEIPFPAQRTNGFFGMKVLRDGRIAVGSFKANPLIYDPASGQAETIPVWEDSFPQDFCYSFLETGEKYLWICTRSSGLVRYDLSAKKVSTFPDLPFHGCADILEDRHGNLWVSTENGLFRLSSEGALIGGYHKEDGLGGNKFIFHTAVYGVDSNLIFGGEHGLSVVNPDIFQPAIKRNLVFEDLMIGGDVVSPESGSALGEALAKKPHVRLGHRDNHFSVSFIDLNPGNEKNAHYYSKLEGLDKDWTDIGSSRQAYFNNIPAGNYEVKVRIARSDQQVVEAEESFPLTVLPAPWASWWAKLLYLMAAVFAAWQALAVRKRILDERRAKEKEAFEKEQERKVNDMNMRFFANISHEFRTPLTMISGPVGILEKTDYLKPREHKLVDTIKWNAARMLKLVNQLMDFNKLENDALRLKVSSQDLVALTEQVLSMFRVSMDEKKITLKTEGLIDTLPAVVDPDKVDKVLTNLLSNAVKYTPEGGTIGLKLDTDGEKITFEVSDDGPSIPEDQLERIFERYFQVEDHHNYGTGIGLYFARRLMQLHHGSIHAENLPDGVKFIAEFPAKDIYRSEEHVEVQQMQQVLFPVGDAAETAATQHENSILVVDDDSGIVNYLKILLSPSYNIFYAYNAEGALKELEEHKPDLILSDVAMPGMDGYDLCRKIKADAEICHLPVILVTAKTTTDEQIAGLNTGADAYVTKPFDPEYLQALIRSLLENRARIRGIIANATTTKEIEEEASDALSGQDKALMDRLYAIMEEELSNEEVNINKLTGMLYMSRTKLYYKIKGLTGETPNVFFKKYKLNRAAEMLRSGEHNISEVSDLTGFSSPTVFSRNFRAQFGMTPTEYVSQAKKK